MPVGLLCAIGTSLCYGTGSVLQSAAAGRAGPARGLTPRSLLDLLLSLARSWRYSLGLALDGAGFALSFVALRSLPLYVVQSVMSGFLAVTAVVSVLTLGLRLRRREVGALVVVVLALALVGLSAAPQSSEGLGASAQWGVLAAAVGLAVVSVALVRSGGGPGAWSLGAVSGLAFGVVAVAARGLSASLAAGSPGQDFWTLTMAPPTYAVLLAAPLALAGYAAALQRGTVVQATAPLLVGETVLPTLAGLVVLGDHPRPGWGPLATVGFVLAVGASLLLAGFGDGPPGSRP